MFIVLCCVCCFYVSVKCTHIWLKSPTLGECGDGVYMGKCVCVQLRRARPLSPRSRLTRQSASPLHSSFNATSAKTSFCVLFVVVPLCLSFGSYTVRYYRVLFNIAFTPFAFHCSNPPYTHTYADTRPGTRLCITRIVRLCLCPPPPPTRTVAAPLPALQQVCWPSQVTHTHIHIYHTHTYIPQS